MLKIVAATGILSLFLCARAAAAEASANAAIAMAEKGARKNPLDVPDADGKLFRHEMVAIANGKGKGWVDYKFRNPASGKVEAKTSYALRAGDVALAGIYKH